MPRQKRQKSESGIYHIILRGVNRQNVFQDQEDYEKFLQVLSDCKAISEFKVYAYCLMSNHIHIIIQESTEKIDLIMKRIGTRYVYWYNIKYKRVGHLFQDRFLSEPIDDESYLLSAIRYIHKNPVKAKIVNVCSDYKYSSYNDFKAHKDFVDYQFVYDIINEKEFENFHNRDDILCHLEIDENPKIRVTDEEAKRIIFKVTGARSVEEYQKLPSNKQTKSLSEFRKKNLSIRQISRLTGLSIGIIRKHF